MANNEEKKLAAFVEIIGECKNNSNPLVFIERPKNNVDNRYPPEELIFPSGDKQAFFRLGFDQMHYNFASHMKAVQFCRIHRKGKIWHANHGGLYDSLFYPMAKALTARKNEILKHNHLSKWSYFWVLVPVVVTSGDIFSVDSTDVEPEPVEKNYVNFRRDIQSENLKGTFSVDFIRQSRLEQFYADCLQPLIDKIVDLTMN